MSSSSHRPDVVVVVLDCVRSSDFPGSKAEMPFCEALRRESIVFPRATSPAPWTIPSHAGLFTGLAPWESGCHSKSDIRLRASVDRVPAMLASAGYRTMSLSANTFIQPSFGLVDGFQQAAWGGWWEPFLRANASRPPNELPTRATEAPVASPMGLTHALRPILSRSRAVLVRHPFLLEQASHLAQGMQGDDGTSCSRMARWIEPTFRQWVSSTSREMPIFAFVNLLDAHEPYFRRAPGRPPSCTWFEYASVRQERLAWMTGAWTPRPTELALLHQLYVQMIHGLDARLASLVEILKDSGRWENTMLVVTSDHGQAFGEHGMLFHMSRLDDELLRIPLWLRLPGGELGGSEAAGWASLIDVAPTVLDQALGHSKTFPSGVALTNLIDRERVEPAVSISDGIIWQHFRGRNDSNQFESFDRVLGASYWNNQKAVVDIERDTAEIHDLGKAGSQPVAVGPSDPEWSSGLVQAARSAGRQVAAAPPASLGAEVEDRLRAWGYM